MRKFYLTMLFFCIIGGIFVISVPRAEAARYNVSPKNSLATGLVGYWTFDGADVDATKVYDKSGQNNTGTRNGSMVMGLGKIGQAGKFDGGDDYVSAGNNINFGTGDFSYSLWTKGDAVQPNSYPAIFGQWAAGASPRVAIGLFQNGGLRNWAVDSNSVGDTGGGPNVFDGSWHHIVLVVDYSVGFLSYVDGVLVNTKVVSFTGNFNFNVAPTIGEVGDQAYYKGFVDDVRIYSRALSSSEIWQLYQMGGSKIAKSPVNSLTTGLVGYWTFDGADVDATKVYDKSGQNNHGTRTGGVAMSIGKIGQAGKFDGADDYVDVGNAGSTLTDNFTLSAWIKGSANNVRILSRRPSGTQWDWYVDNNRVQFYTGTSYGGAKIVTDNQWHLATIVINGANSSFYVDGAKDGSNFSPTLTAQAGNTLIGAFASGSSPWNGSLDDVRIYSRALSASEIWQLYQMGGSKIAKSPVNSLTTGLVGYWTFDGADVDATKVYDKSGQNNTGTRAGGVAMSFGKIGQAGKFDGGDDYVNCGSNASLSMTQAVTVSAWFKPAAGVSNARGVINGGTSIDGYSLYAGGGANQYIFMVNNQYSPIVTIPNNQWTHLIGTYDKQSIKIYKDGVLQGTPTSYTADIIAPTQPCLIGRDISGSYPYNGSIDDVRVYSRALSAQEVWQLYMMGK